MFRSVVDPLESLAGRKVTVMGLGLFGGGRGAVEFLCAHGADVTVTDLRDQDVLAPTVEALSHLPVRWVLGRHEERDFLGADLVIPSPAVPRTAALLRACCKRSVPLDTEMNLFFKYCPARICAVTGSNGKTTTTSLIAAMARCRWPEVRAGGNLGRSLLPEVGRIESREWVVLELSSFQLEDLAALERRPDIAVVTNLSPNHLDRHGSYASYRAAKRSIIAAAEKRSVAVLNGEDPLVRSWGRIPHRAVYFGRFGPVFPRRDGVWVDLSSGHAIRTSAAGSTIAFELRDCPLLGRFNLLNAAAAAAAAFEMGCDPGDVQAALQGFQPIRHRLEPVGVVDSVGYVNDSVSTTPESTIAALEALSPHVVLICGGSDKGCSFRALGAAISRHARAVVVLGTTAERIAQSIPEHAPGGSPLVRRCADLRAAVLAARSLARSGDSVLLSPACPSYDQFVHFEERGQHFRELVEGLAGKPVV